MASDTKSLLFEVRAASGTNNIRKYLAAYVFNFTSDSQIFQSLERPIGPGDSFTWEPVQDNTVNLIVTTSPLTALLTVPLAISYQLTLSKVWFLDYSIQTVVFTNNSTTDTARLSIISG